MFTGQGAACIGEALPLCPWDPWIEAVNEYPKVTVALQLESRQFDVVGDFVDVIIRVGCSPRKTSLIARRLTALPMTLCASPSETS